LLEEEEDAAAAPKQPPVAVVQRRCSGAATVVKSKRTVGVQWKSGSCVRVARRRRKSRVLLLQ